MSIATASWTTPETDPQRRAILAAADRLLAGTPRYSSGNLSVVQLAVEAQVKYWVVAQRHTDLRDHFQALARAAANGRGTARHSERARNWTGYARNATGFVSTAPAWNNSSRPTPP